MMYDTPLSLFDMLVIAGSGFDVQELGFMQHVRAMLVTPIYLVIKAVGSSEPMRKAPITWMTLTCLHFLSSRPSSQFRQLSRLIARDVAAVKGWAASRCGLPSHSCSRVS
eukprot:7381244-Prymnesium_polylepis.1